MDNENTYSHDSPNHDTHVFIRNMDFIGDKFILFYSFKNILTIKEHTELTTIQLIIYHRRHRINIISRSV